MDVARGRHRLGKGKPQFRPSRSICRLDSPQELLAICLRQQMSHEPCAWIRAAAKMQGLQDIGMSYKNLVSRVVPWFRLAKRDAAKGGGVPVAVRCSLTRTEMS